MGQAPRLAGLGISAGGWDQAAGSGSPRSHGRWRSYGEPRAHQNRSGVRILPPDHGLQKASPPVSVLHRRARAVPGDPVAQTESLHPRSPSMWPAWVPRPTQESSPTGGCVRYEAPKRSTQPPHAVWVPNSQVTPTVHVPRGRRNDPTLCPSAARWTHPPKPRDRSPSSHSRRDRGRIRYPRRTSQPVRDVPAWPDPAQPQNADGP